VAELLAGRSLATAESVTAGRVAEALAAVEKASEFLRGGLIAYQEPVKRDLLGVVAESVVSPGAAAQMAAGAARLFGADVTIATTGLAGHDPVDGQPGGTVFVATSVDGVVDVAEHHFDGTPAQICVCARNQALADLEARLRISAGT
jgi:nicotinamide-nucleotide amidase